MRAGLGVALVGLVVCVGCGAQWQEHARDNRLRKAMAAIEKLGGKLVVDEGYDVVIVDLSATKVTDAGLVHLKRLTKLKYLNLRDTKVTDASVKKLQQALPNCKILH